VISTNFQRDAGVAAIAAGVAGFLYSVAFVFVARAAPQAAVGLYSLLLLLGGLLGSLALVALWERLREEAPAVAVWALAVGLFATLGSAIHGGYDLANAVLVPPKATFDFPSQVDPRGLLTFGFAGLAVGAFSMLMHRAGGWPARLPVVGYVSAALLVVVYLLRLLVPNSQVVLAPAAVEGFVVNPLWYILLGLELRR
jgi:hypothetical protein